MTNVLLLDIITIVMLVFLSMIATLNGIVMIVTLTLNIRLQDRMSKSFDKIDQVIQRIARV